MPRPMVPFIPGAHYHIYNRGARRLPIVREERNYALLLDLMRRSAELSGLTVLAYCLLPNHYHWLVRQDGDTPVSRLPKRVFASYTQKFNRTYGGSGVLFEGMYRARLVETQDYLRHLCRYIHANPVRHGLAATPELWPHSDYRDWIGLRRGGPADPAFVREHFGSAQVYAAFVWVYLLALEPLPEDLTRFQDTLEL